MSISAASSSLPYLAQLQPAQRPPAVVIPPPQANAPAKPQSAAPAPAKNDGDGDTDNSGIGSIIDVKA